MEVLQCSHQSRNHQIAFKTAPVTWNCGGVPFSFLSLFLFLSPLFYSSFSFFSCFFFFFFFFFVSSHSVSLSRYIPSIVDEKTSQFPSKQGQKRGCICMWMWMYRGDAYAKGEDGR
ncbi:hypothetical protein F4779DRAFT_585266 [Xylariaceae sp. FL0662B]|nr:hypothetical protein F4779DRAFT_585266 [Xylariaceae sp. FL0662B]